jgi:cell division transport system permease protein
VNAAQIGYVFDEAATMLRRHKAANAVSIVIMGLSLLILVVFLLITLNMQAVIDRAGDEMRMYVFLEDGAGEPAARDIQMRLLGLAGVEEVVYVPREEALVSFREALGKDSDILDALESNPLPDAFRVKLKPDYIRSERLEAMSQEIGRWKGVEETRYGERWLERGEALVKGFYFADLFVGLIILLSVIFVIANTVRLTVISRQRSIEVARLVGATNAYIRIPFLVEGAVQGAVAAGLAVGLAAIVHALARRHLPGLLFLGGEAIAAFVFVCMVLGAVVSLGAMRRLLRL